MPSIITSISFSSAINLNTGSIVITDTTDYATPSIPLSGVVGCITNITSPALTVVYSNSNFSAPDVTRQTSASSTTIIPPPLNVATGLPELGLYSITYEVEIDDGVNPVYYVSQTNTFTNAYVQPTPCIEATVDCASPLFTAEDTTAYTVASVTPTITRTLEIAFPFNQQNQQVAPTISTTAATLSVTNFYNGTQTIYLTSVVSYAFTGFTLIDTISATRAVEVDCTDVCSIYCCTQSLANRLIEARTSNRTEYGILSQLASVVGFLMNQLSNAIKCGRGDDTTALISAIKTIANCTDDCGCSDNTVPTLVTGLGLTLSTTVDSGGSPVVVTPATVGSNTNYAVSLTPAFVTLVNSLNNAVVVAGTNVTVTASALVNNTITYTVNATVPAVINQQEFNCEVVYTNYAVPAVAITNTNYNRTGANFNADASVESVGFGTDVNWPNLPNQFRVYGFQAVVGQNIKAHVELSLVSRTPYLGRLITGGALSPRIFGIEVFDINSIAGEFYFRIVSPDGATLTNGWMVESDFIVNVKIEQ